MNAVLESPISGDVRQVIFPATGYPLAPPQVFQETTGTSIIPDRMVSNDVVLYITKNARVWFGGVRTLIIDQAGRTLYQYGPHPDIDPEMVKEAQAVHLDGSTLFLGHQGTRNYYHWTVDLLPKLKVLQEAGVDLAAIDHFVFRSLDQPFQMAMLKILGIPEEKIYRMDETPCLACDTLFHVELANFVGMKMHRFVPEFLRNLFLREVETIKTGRKLFIARPKDEKRPIENEQKILDVVTAHGFEVLTVRGLSFYEQASLFYSADTIITAHGAVLTNLVHCRPGTNIVELFGSHVFSYFYGLANLCQLDYTAILRSADQYDLVIDADVGNRKTDQGTTIVQASSLNIEVLKKALAAL